MDTHICFKCKQERHITEFYCTERRGYSWCKQCGRDWAKDYYKKNKKRIQETNRKHQLKYTYGITEEEFLQRSVAQDNRCFICGEEETRNGGAGGGKRPLSIDHDHTTGEVRALLCGRCNSAVGFVQESSEVAMKLGGYLHSYGK